MLDHNVGPSTGKANWSKVAAYAAGGIVCVLALFLVVAGLNMKPENPVARIRDECQKKLRQARPDASFRMPQRASHPAHAAIKPTVTPGLHDVCKSVAADAA